MRLIPTVAYMTDLQNKHPSTYTTKCTVGLTWMAQLMAYSNQRYNNGTPPRLHFSVPGTFRRTDCRNKSPLFCYLLGFKAIGGTWLPTTDALRAPVWEFLRMTEEEIHLGQSHYLWFPDLNQAVLEGSLKKSPCLESRRRTSGMLPSLGFVTLLIQAFRPGDDVRFL